MLAFVAAALSFVAPSAVQAPLKLREFKKNRWDMSAEIPVLSGSDRLTKLANASVQAFERKQFAAFLGTARQDEKEFRRAEPMRYSYDAATTVKLKSARVISVTTGVFRYMGGAHGIGQTTTHNFGYVAGKAKLLSIWDVIRTDASTKNELRLLLLGKAVKEPYTDWVQDGSKQEFTKDEIERFWVHGMGLVWEFDPYELGSYASGPFTLTLTWKELAPLMRPNNPFESVMRG